MMQRKYFVTNVAANDNKIKHNLINLVSTMIYLPFYQSRSLSLQVHIHELCFPCGTGALNEWFTRCITPTMLETSDAATRRTKRCKIEEWKSVSWRSLISY